LKRAAAAGVTIVGRLRKDAAMRDLPPKLRRGKCRPRRPPRKYGPHKISLAKRAGYNKGSQELTCTIYGQTVTKTCKTSLATYRPAGGVIRVVLIREGPTPTDHEQRIIDDQCQLAAAAKNPRPNPTPDGPGRLTQLGPPKVQL
jgi:hypothetical protein